MSATQFVTAFFETLTLAFWIAHGADVLLITSPKLPDLPDVDIDTSRGKRTTQLDLAQAEDRSKLQDLVKDADVFLQAYRPGGLADKGFGVADVVAARPGIVYASLCAYGWNGPWKDRRGVCSWSLIAANEMLTELQVRLACADCDRVQCG